MWVQPGGREALKFLGETRGEAESAAALFIEDQRVSRGLRAAGPAESTPGIIARVALAPKPAAAEPVVDRPARRILQRLLVRFGLDHPNHPGVTANLSETGLFIITDQPRPIGTEVAIDLRFAHQPIILGGEVVWVSAERHEGRSVGFGVKLVRRPGEYLQQLRTLWVPRLSSRQS
jgi:hypothetical protein